MAVLRDDRYRRGRVVRPRIGIGALHLALIFCAAVLLLLGRLDHPVSRGLQTHVQETSAHMLVALYDALIPLNTLWRAGGVVSSDGLSGQQQSRQSNELHALRGEVARLRRELAEIRQTSSFVQVEPGKMTTARVLATSHSGLRQTLLIQAGHEHGVKDGFPVFGARGLIGRTIGTGPTTTRVLLLDDVKSRIPVVIGPSRIRAIGAGSGRRGLSLAYLARGREPKDGDRVLTSGAGGVFPAGLPIGRVTWMNGRPGVRFKGISRPSLIVSIRHYDGERQQSKGRLNGARLNPNESVVRGTKSSAAEDPQSSYRRGAALPTKQRVQ